MCSIEAYDRFHPTRNGNGSSGDGIPLTHGITPDVLRSLVHKLIFIDSWLHSFKNNFLQQKVMWRDKINGLFKKTTVTILEPQPNYYKNNKKILLTDIAGKWYTNNITVKSPPIRRPKLSKESTTRR